MLYSLLRVNNIICFFNRIKILEVIKNRKRLNKLNSVFEKKMQPKYNMRVLFTVLKMLGKQSFIKNWTVQEDR